MTHGLRGAGKKVLLGTMRDEVESRDRVGASLEAAGTERDFRQQLAERLHPCRRSVILRSIVTIRVVRRIVGECSDSRPQMRPQPGTQIT
ncbi:MAG: hypothetical protein JWN22_1093 [Nocardioides sp.]|nr:hypothetical protein [Nocardioides sp.]